MKAKGLMICAIILLSTTGFALPQRGGGRGGRGGARGNAGRTVANVSPAQREEEALTIFEVFLFLDKDQQQQIKTIFDNALKEADAVRGDTTPGGTPADALFLAAKSQKSDDELEKLAEQQATLTMQGLKLQAKTLSKVMVILHDDQKSKIDEFLYNEVGSLLGQF